MRRISQLFISALVVFAPLLTTLQALADDEEAPIGEFDSFEIRVITPRYFSKRFRLEVGGELGLITNQTLIYTFLYTGILTFHLTEQLALEASASLGSSIDRDEKKVLENDFDIKTSIMRTDHIFMGNLVYTPMYGKFQLASGNLLYFDTFLTVGAGTTGVRYKYEQCLPIHDSAGAIVGPARAEQVVSYPVFAAGIGQRFFLDQSSSIRWDITDNFYTADSADGACSEHAESESENHQDVVLRIGYSYFF